MQLNTIFPYIYIFNKINIYKISTSYYSDVAIRYLLINEGPFVVTNEVVSVYRISG